MFNSWFDPSISKSVKLLNEVKNFSDADPNERSNLRNAIVMSLGPQLALTSMNIAEYAEKQKVNYQPKDVRVFMNLLRVTANKEVFSDMAKKYEQVAYKAQEVSDDEANSLGYKFAEGLSYLIALKPERTPKGMKKLLHKPFFDVFEQYTNFLVKLFYQNETMLTNFSLDQMIASNKR